MTNRLISWLSGNKLFIEVLAVTFALLFYILTSTQLMQETSPLIFTMIILAIFYFISAYFVLELNDLPGIIATKVVGIASAISVLGILFFIRGEKGAAQALLIGASSLGVACVILVIAWVRTQNKAILPLIIRAIILVPLTGWLLMAAIK